jgi:hypothetical protein
MGLALEEIENKNSKLKKYYFDVLVARNIVLTSCIYVRDRGREDNARRPATLCGQFNRKYAERTWGMQYCRLMQFWFSGACFQRNSKFE